MGEFFPMRTGATQTAAQVRGQSYFDAHWNGQTWAGNSVQYNPGGSNWRLKMMGQTTAGASLSQHAAELQHSFQVFLARPDDTFDLVMLPVTVAVRDALTERSVWTERTPGASGRDYGRLDPARLAQPVDMPAKVRLAWRYQILPQLVDTLTQLGATDLADPDRRSEWLESNEAEDVRAPLASFDAFLAGSLGVHLVERGHGLARTLAVEVVLQPAPTPPPAAARAQPAGTPPATVPPAQPPTDDVTDPPGEPATDAPAPEPAVDAAEAAPEGDTG